VVDLCVQHLASSGSSAATPGRPKKKQRKQAALTGAAAGGEEAGEATTAAAEAEAWVLKGRVLRALHRCFLYDSVGFVDQDKVCGRYAGMGVLLGEHAYRVEV